MILFGALGITAQTLAQKTQDQIITFDAAPNVRTLPQSINPSGVVTGYYIEASNIIHGFVRAADGTITTFDVGPRVTFPASINPSGEITGWYFDANGAAHAFVRDRDGTITTFDDRDAPCGSVVRSNGTFPASINPRGEITGYCNNSSPAILFGFVRAADGTITTFDAGQRKTVPQSINPSGVVTGYYSSLVGHGFVRAADGTITTFDAGPYGTIPRSINPRGEIAGYTYASNSSLTHGFVRAADGIITTFDAGPNGTIPASINPRGEITGSYADATNVAHGFVREP
jgi:WD40 repeat protein